MKKISWLVAFLSCFMLAMPLYAAKNPIGFSLVPASGFPAQTKVGSSYAVVYTLTNNLPFPVPVTISRIYAGNTFTINDGCNKTLAPNGTCKIAVGLLPANSGTHQLTVVVRYGNNQVPLPMLTTNSTSGTTSDNVSGFISQPLPPDVQVGTAYPLTFNFINNGNSSVTATSVVSSGFTATSNGCSVPLAANSSCSVEGTFTPSTAGQVSLSTTYNYTNNGAKSIPLTTTSVAENTGVGCDQLTGLAVLPLPLSTFVYSDNVVKFTFTNHCDATSQTLGRVKLTAISNGLTINNILTKGSSSGVSDTCSNTTLAPNGSCSVYVSVIPTTPSTSLSVEAYIPYSGGTKFAAAVSAEQVNAIPNQTTKHTVTFVNQCRETVWFEFLNGQPASSGVLSPDPIAGSPPDAYKIPGQSGGAPSVKTLSITQYENGKINARTKCDPTTMVCATASCQVISGTGTCVVGAGAGQPSTAFESYMTGTAGTDGVYDVSIINGFNVPVEIKGMAPVSTQSQSANANAPYSCTGAGAPIQPPTSYTPPLGACPWIFTPPNGGMDATPNFVFVSAGSDDACTSDTDCAGTPGTICGTAWASNINTGAGTPINRRCGFFQGYWTVADFIGYNQTSQWGPIDLYTTYQISSPLPGAYGNSTVNAGAATNYDLYGCTPTTNDSLNSGYKPGKSRVCGCYNWDQAGSPALTNVTQQCCTSTNAGACNAQAGVVDAPNPLWGTTVFDRVKWLKAACPTAYAYQFDDKSSSFQCNQTGQFTGYQIVFCPAGKTGNPSA